MKGEKMRVYEYWPNAEAKLAQKIRVIGRPARHFRTPRLSGVLVPLRPTNDSPIDQQIYYRPTSIIGESHFVLNLAEGGGRAPLETGHATVVSDPNGGRLTPWMISNGGVIGEEPHASFLAVAGVIAQVTRDPRGKFYVQLIELKLHEHGRELSIYRQGFFKGYHDDTNLPRQFRTLAKFGVEKADCDLCTHVHFGNSYSA